VLDDSVDASTLPREVGGCPVKCITVFDDQAAGGYWQQADAVREETPAFSNAHASPGAVARAEDPAPAIARWMVEEIAATGPCDVVTELAIRFPTEVLLTVIGLPPETPIASCRGSRTASSASTEPRRGSPAW
jgi:hypothetical protein